MRKWFWNQADETNHVLLFLLLALILTLEGVVIVYDPDVI